MEEVNLGICVDIQSIKKGYKNLGIKEFKTMDELLEYINEPIECEKQKQRIYQDLKRYSFVDFDNYRLNSLFY